MACGVGFYDQQAPWGTEWFGKAANNSGWYNNFRIPFQKSIVVTVQHLYNNHSRFFFMIKGSINLPITVGRPNLFEAFLFTFIRRKNSPKNCENEPS